MPLYNAERYVAEAVESILGQTWRDLELVVVDDGSTDGSADVVQRFADPRVRYHHQPNQGESVARNTGLDLARGEFVVWQDSDDVSLPHRVETLLDAARSPQIGFVHSDMALIDEHGDPIGYWMSSNVAAREALRFFLAVGTPYNNPSMLVRREAFAGLRYPAGMVIGPDSDAVSQFATEWAGAHVPEALVLYRRHSNNISRGAGEEDLRPMTEAFLARHSLRELVPEAGWDSLHTAEAGAVARAVVALFLARRGLKAMATEWSGQVITPGGEAGCLTRGIARLAAGDVDGAATELMECDDSSAVAHNYLGECLALKGRHEEAFQCFLRAVQLDPTYAEPKSNLQAVAARRHFSLIDQRLGRYLSA